MNLNEYVDMMFAGDTSAYAGRIKIKDFFVNIQCEIKESQNKMPVLVNNFSINKTNVALAATYVVDMSKDKKDKIILDIEALASFMFFGVEKVAKANVLTEE